MPRNILVGLAANFFLMVPASAEPASVVLAGRTVAEPSSPPENRSDLKGEAPGAERTFIVRLLAWLGHFHPAVVHFPIALLVAAAAAELLLLRTGRTSLAAARSFCLWLAAPSAFLAGLLGWFYAEFQLREETDLLELHQWLGTAAIGLAFLALVLQETSRRREGRGWPLALRTALFLAAALVLLSGYFGGVLVHGPDHYVWPEG